MSKQELLKSFCDLLDVEVLEYRSVGCYGLTAIVVEPDDFAHDFHVSIQNIGLSGTTFALSATKQTEAILKNLGLDYKDNKINLGKFLVTI
jgi:hypothetical protein